MNRKTRNWLLMIVPLVLTGILFLRILILHNGHHDEQYKLRSKQVSGSGTVDQVSPWQNGRFVDVNSSETLIGITNAVEANIGISMKQREELEDSIGRFFEAYSAESFENYFEFKTHRSAYSLDFTGETGRLLQVLMATRTNLPPFPQEPKAKLEKIWEIITGASTNGIGPCLQQVDTSSIRVLITTNADPIPWIFLQAGDASKTNPKRLNPNFAPHSFFQYGETPEIVMKKDKQLILAMLEANARYSTSDNASPVFVVYYWSNESVQWYPWVLGKYPTAKFNVMF